MPPRRCGGFKRGGAAAPGRSLDAAPQGWGLLKKTGRRLREEALMPPRRCGGF